MPRYRSRSSSNYRKQNKKKKYSRNISHSSTRSRKYSYSYRQLSLESGQSRYALRKKKKTHESRRESASNRREGRRSISEETRRILEHYSPPKHDSDRYSQVRSNRKHIKSKRFRDCESNIDNEDGEIITRKSVNRSIYYESRPDIYSCSRSRSSQNHHRRKEISLSKSPLTGRISRRNRLEYRREPSSQSRNSEKTSSSCDNCSEKSHIEEEPEVHYTEEEYLKKFFGTLQFDSSKGKAHIESDVSGVNKRSKRRYRQYMNRRGGFNRPLSPVF